MCSRSSERNINTIEVLFKMKIKSLAFLARVFVYVCEIFGTSVHNINLKFMVYRIFGLCTICCDEVIYHIPI